MSKFSGCPVIACKNDLCETACQALRRVPASCKIFHYSAPLGPPYYDGSAVAHAQCETHGYNFGALPVSAGTLCPFGRIEKATAEALAAIEAAKAKP